MSADPNEPEELETHSLARREGAALAPTGSHALGRIPPEVFAEHLSAMVLGRERLQEVQWACMSEGIHYAKVPGREKDPKATPGLLKPGAEILHDIHTLKMDFAPTITWGDRTNAESPAITVVTRCEAHLGTLEGPVVAVGYGAANTWETKYRWRQAARTCPDCGKPAIMRSKKEAKGGPYRGLRPWWCNTYKDGCGAEFAPEDQRLADQPTGRITNEDAYDLLNTILKMAEKRADVGTTIRAASASDLFTQDVEDMGAEGAQGVEKMSEEDAARLYDEAMAGDRAGRPQGDQPPREPWGVGPGEAKPAAAARPPAAPPPARAKPPAAGARGADVATEAQLTLIAATMKRRLGIEGAEGIAAYLRQHFDAPWPGLRALQAGNILAKLQIAEPEAPGAAPGPAAPPAAPARPAPEELPAVRAAHLARIAQFNRDLEGLGAPALNRTHEGRDYLEHPALLASMGFRGARYLDIMSMAELQDLGDRMQGYVEAAEATS